MSRKQKNEIYINEGQREQEFDKSYLKSFNKTAKQKIAIDPLGFVDKQLELAY